MRRFEHSPSRWAVPVAAACVGFLVGGGIAHSQLGSADEDTVQGAHLYVPEETNDAEVGGGQETPPLDLDFGKTDRGCKISNRREPIVDDPIPDKAARYITRSTLYYPEDPAGNPKIEGGMSDRKYPGRLRCHSLDDYLEGKTGQKGEGPYVALAMDKTAFEYGTLVRIPEIEEKHGDGRVIYFRVVDTGGAFVNQGTGRIDIMVRSKSSAFNWLGKKPELTLVKVDDPGDPE